MRYQDIIKRAWIITQEHRYLRAFGTMTSVFFLLIGLSRVRYILPQPIGTFHDIQAWISGWTDDPMPWLIAFYSFVVIVYLASFITHILSEGGMVAAIAKIEKRGETLTFGRTFALGMHFFLPLVEYGALTSLFDISRYIIVILLVRFYARVYGIYQDTILYSFPWFFVFLGVFIAIISFLLTYAQYHLVIRKAGIIASIKKSITLVTFHFGETFFVALLVGLITVRALINLILVFLIPLLVYYFISFATALVSFNIALAIGSTLGLVLFWFAARISGVLMVFTTAVWTLMYLHLDELKADVVLEDEEEHHDTTQLTADH